jgi:hypothetical protein
MRRDRSDLPSKPADFLTQPISVVAIHRAPAPDAR